jgi:formate/nitrite transporter FocA (FNT family)
MGAVTLGNIIGGILFVAILKYSPTALSDKEEEVDIGNAAERR